MTYRKTKDHRGEFRELLKASKVGFDIKQVSIFTINAGKIRGGHYHKATKEAFMVLDGTVDFRTETPKWYKVVEYRNHDGFFTTEVGVKHTLYAKYGATVLVVSDREFNPDNPDIFTTYE